MGRLSGRTELSYKRYIFHCGHERIFRNPYPSKDELLICGECGEATWIEQGPLPLREYWFRCEVCNVARRFAGNSMDCKGKAVKHALNKLHVVHVYFSIPKDNSAKPIQTIRPQIETLSLPMNDADGLPFDPPF